MANRLDDTYTLDCMADEIVSGRAKHPTGAMRNLGITNESVERRLQKKWAKARDDLLRSAARRLPLLAESYRRGCEDGWDEALRLVGKVYGSSVPSNVLYRPNGEGSARKSDGVPAQDKEIWVPLPEAARRLGLPSDTIRRRLDRGRIAGVRLPSNGRIMIKMKGNKLVHLDRLSRDVPRGASPSSDNLPAAEPVNPTTGPERRRSWVSRMLMWRG